METPPAPLVFLTVTWAVPAVAKSEASNEAWIVPALIKVVVRLDPFHRTESPEANPAPLIVSVVAGLPGAAVVGARGWFSNGTGLVPDTPVPVSVTGTGETADARVTLSVALRLPAAEGVKTTLILQEAPTETLPHAFV